MVIFSNIENVRYYVKYLRISQNRTTMLLNKMCFKSFYIELVNPFTLIYCDVSKHESYVFTENIRRLSHITDLKEKFLTIMLKT